MGHNPYDVNIEHYCAPVVHPVTGKTITQYKKLSNNPLLKEIWTTGLGNEVGRMIQGNHKIGTKGTNFIFVMSHVEISNIPRDRVVTYCRLVVDFWLQKENPNRVRMTAWDNILQYPGELTTRTADLTTSKIVWNSVLSTEGARFMGIDIKNFYLGTPLDQFEYMKMPLHLLPEHIIEQYNMR